jgi:hypothetical protein
MKNETQIRAAIRKIIRKAKQDESTVITVEYSDNYSQLERDLIEEILACDESTVCFRRKYDGFFMGSIFFVFDYDSEPDEIVCDCTDNAYTHNLLKTEADQ